MVGSGNTGAEIALDLVESGARSVRISVRTPPHIVFRQQNGIANPTFGVLMRHLPPRVVDPIARRLRTLTIGDLTEYGLATPTDGLYERVLREEAIPIVDIGFIDALKAGKLSIVAGRGRVRRATGCCWPTATRLVGGRGRRGDRLSHATSARWSGTSACSTTTGARRARRPHRPARTEPVVHRLHQPDQRELPRDGHRRQADRARRRACAALGRGRCAEGQRTTRRSRTGASPRL